jgi:hypothetical protein
MQFLLFQAGLVRKKVLSTKSKSDYLPDAGADMATVEKLARFAPKAEQGV